MLSMISLLSVGREILGTSAERRRFINATIGIVLLAVNLNVLSWMYKIVSGGMPGYGLALNFLFDVPVGLFLLVTNTLILVIMLIVEGKSAGIKAIYGYVLLSVAVDGIRRIVGLEQVELQNVGLQVVISVLQALTAAIPIGIVLRNGYTFGSWTSILPLIKRIIPSLTIYALVFIADFILAIIVLMTMSWEKSLLLLLNAVIFFFVLRFSMSVKLPLWLVDRKT